MGWCGETSKLFQFERKLKRMAHSTQRTSWLCLNSIIPAPSNGSFQGLFPIKLMPSPIMRRWTLQRFCTLLALHMHSIGCLRDNFSFNIQSWNLVWMKISCHGDQSISTQSTYKIKTKHWLYSRQISKTWYAQLLRLTHLIKALEWIFGNFHRIFQCKRIM